eukprot:GEMP01041166.1.p1 GENE.GEMP01041166.1~~GEMP01041166.1.p1  ORF type:complete len:268 (+),score=74.12 GEMP01041166.1:264-1067(+)
MAKYVSQLGQLRSGTFNLELGQEEREITVYDGPLGLKIDNTKPPTVQEITDNAIFWKNNGLVVGSGIVAINDVPVLDREHIKCFLTSYPLRIKLLTPTGIQELKEIPCGTSLSSPRSPAPLKKTPKGAQTKESVAQVLPAMAAVEEEPKEEPKEEPTPAVPSPAEEEDADLLAAIAASLLETNEPPAASPKEADTPEADLAVDASSPAKAPEKSASTIALEKEEEEKLAAAAAESKPETTDTQAAAKPKEKTGCFGGKKKKAPKTQV